MSNLRLQIIFKPLNILTTVGSSTSLLPNSSYLRILNCVEFVKVNTTNNEPLKIGQSFYMYFNFTEQFLSYDPLTRSLGLTKNVNQRTEFKILTDHFDWNSRGNIETGMLFKYRIILAQDNSKILHNQAGQLVASSNINENSLVSFQKSIYNQDFSSYPIKLTSLQNGMTLCYKQNKASVQKRPSLCQYMVIMQSKSNGSDLYSIRHVDSNNYLVKSGKQFIFMRDPPAAIKYCLKRFNYNDQQNYLNLQPADNQNLFLSPILMIPVTNSNPLQSILHKQICTEESIKNIQVSAWLKAEKQLQKNQNNILFILAQCETKISAFCQNYEQNIIDGLLTQGLFQDLQYICKKYDWNIVGEKVITIVQNILNIRQSWIAYLFNVEYLYEKLMQEEEIIKIVKQISINSEQLNNPHRTLKDVENLIYKQINLTSLETMLIVSQIVKIYAKQQQHKEMKQYINYVCSQIVPQLKKQQMSSFFTIGLRLVKANTTPAFFTSQVIKNLSLSLLQNNILKLEDKLILIKMFEEETGPYVFITSQCLEVRSLTHQKKHEKTIALFIEDVLPKNCRFETHQFKTISVALLKYHIKVCQNIQLNDCKQYVRSLIQSSNSYYYDQNPEVFLRQMLRTFDELINRILILDCHKSLQYDSVTHQKSQRILKCKKQIDSYVNFEVINLPMIWPLFDVHKKLTKSQQKVFILALKVFEKIICPQEYLSHLISVMKLLEDPSPQLIKIISLFLMREHQFHPIKTQQKITQLCKNLQQDELSVIASLINENDMFDKICYKVEPFYKVMNILSTAKIIQSNIIKGQKILQVLKSRKSPWIQNDVQFAFLRNLIIIIGGVVTVPIYQCYQRYICTIQPDKWSLQFFRLCTTFFNMSPPALKKKFVIVYNDGFKSVNEGFKLQKLFSEKGASFLIYYINLLLAFADFHSSKQLIYQIIGDETFFNLLNQFSTNIQLRIKALNLMVKTRKRVNQFQTLTVNPTNASWLKKGTFYIRQILGNPNSLNQSLEIVHLKDYSEAVLDFLEIRQQIVSKIDISQDQALVIQGTNKIFAFRVAQLISQSLKNDKIEKKMLQKIQWFQNKYKISIDSVQLTQISIEAEHEQKRNENFEYSYMLAIKPSISITANTLLSKMNIEVFVSTLIQVILSICFDSYPNWNNQQLLLNYLHYLISYKIYTFTEQDLELLFLAMRKFIRHKKLKFVATVQNIIRKSIWKNGKLEVRNQLIIQEHIKKFKPESFDFLYQCIDNYTTFSPIYESTLNYFNANGQQSICWSVSCYISTLRFLISLCKSLKIKFKEIFSETQSFKQEFIGSIIQLNKQHISELFKSTSDAKLTIIAYEIQLINNLLRGPVPTNINIALKFKYFQIINLIKLPDLHEDPKRVQTFKIIVQIKKLATEAILILAPFYKFNSEQTRLIEQGLIVYFNSTSKLVNENLDSIIQNYTKQNKQKLEIMNFDLSLNLFFCVMRLYENQGNTKIKQMKTDTLRKIKLVKSYNKKFKIFYQLYRIVAQLIGWMARTTYNCCKRTANQIDQAINLFQWSQATHEQKLNQSFKFFIKNAASIQIQVGQQIETVYFLLLKQTRCYNNSIRKQLHRKVGLGERQYKLTKYMEQVNHVILRLEIQKQIKKFTQRYKPIQIIIKNRQLWKSMNFLCACLLNLVFLESGILQNPQIALYILRCTSYLFCVFLFIIYFIQNLPLKRQLSRQMAQSQKVQKFKKIKSCLQIFNDKTLWFASIYTIVISLSFYQQGFVAVLMIDFFVRFKISKKVTEIVTRPLGQLLIIVLISVQFAFIFTCYQFSIHEQLPCNTVASCIQQTYFQYLGLNKNDVNENDFSNLKASNITEFFLTFLTIMINISLIIGVLLYEKKSKDNKLKQWQSKVKQRCFICDNERNVIDRARNNNKGFFQHIQQQHNLWNYIFYLIYLKNKQLESLNVVENMVLNQWKQKKIDWLPKNYRA